MRSQLSKLYRGAEVLAAFSLVTIAILVIAQVSGRILDGVLKLFGHDPIGLLVPSLAEIAGFLLIAASFLALAGTLRHAAHIRVSLLLSFAPQGLRRWMETLVLTFALALILFFTWNSILLVIDSWKFNEVSFGIIAIPLWIPQTTMAAGFAVFAIALLDDLLLTLGGGTASYVKEEADKGIEGVE